jgi:hypothetical protein
VDRAQQPRDRGPAVTEAAVLAADKILRRHGIRYTIVGGQAIARNAATSTQDVDVMVTTDDFRTAIQKLGADPELTLAWEAKAVARFGIVALHGIPLDVVDAGAFSGTKTGTEFFEFLLTEHSTEADGIFYATPEAVWYTRLLTKRWRAYAEKIVTNVLDGLEAERLSKVEEIARRFGIEPTMEERIAYVREELKRPEIDSLLKRK